MHKHLHGIPDSREIIIFVALKNFCGIFVKTLDFVIIKYYNLCILYKEKANQ